MDQASIPEATMPTEATMAAPTPAPAQMSDEDYKTGLKEQLRKLYDIGTNTMNEMIITSEKKNKPTIKPIEFERWYTNLYNDLFQPTEKVPEGKIKDTSRFNKIIQYGNFGVSQPTGGFNLKEFVTPEFIKEQYAAALKIDEPVLLVITEPFSKNFFLGVQGVNYEIIGKPPCGLLYNDLFKEKYSIEEEILPQKPQNEEIIVTGITAFRLKNNMSGGMMNGFRRMIQGKSKTSKNNIVSAPVQGAENLRRAQEYHKKLMSRSTNKQTNDASMKSNAKTSISPNNSTNGIFIVNFHGDSKGDQGVLNMLHKLIEISKESGVHFILGDSNITRGKTKKTIEQVLKEKELEHIAYSTQKVEKTREICDILKNNQLDKYTMTSEIDGMFAVDLKYESTPIIPDPESVTAFKTEYTLNTPMLGDHSVVGMKVNPGMNPPFRLLAATGASMDHPTKGIFRNDAEWGNVDMSTYHEEFGKPYTLAWIKVYNNWVEGNKEKKGFRQFVQDYRRDTKVFDTLNEKIDDMLLTEGQMKNRSENTIYHNVKRNHNGVPVSGGSKRRKSNKSKSKRLSKRKQVRKRSRKVH
jgi:hypothetical protein